MVNHPTLPPNQPIIAHGSRGLMWLINSRSFVLELQKFIFLFQKTMTKKL